jgi:hypothetical protein
MPCPRFSLRTLLVVVTVLCVAFAFLQYPLMQALATLLLIWIAFYILPILGFSWIVSVMDKAGRMKVDK